MQNTVITMLAAQGIVVSDLIVTSPTVVVAITEDNQYTFTFDPQGKVVSITDDREV